MCMIFTDGRTSRSGAHVGAIINALFEMRQFEYGSQIKERSHKPNVLLAMRQLSSRDYTIEQWNYALTYIAGRDIHLMDIKDLDVFLKDAEKRTDW